MSLSLFLFRRQRRTFLLQALLSLARPQRDGILRGSLVRQIVPLFHPFASQKTGKGRGIETRCKLVSLPLFPASPLVLSLSLSFFREFVAHACTLVLPSLSILLFLSRARIQTQRAERETDSRYAGDWRADWPLADHVGDPTDSHPCSRLVAFRTPVFAASSRASACVRACTREYACVHARFFSRSSFLNPLLSFFPLSLGISRQLRAHHERTLHRRVYACEFYSRLRARFAEIYRVFLENGIRREVMSLDAKGFQIITCSFNEFPVKFHYSIIVLLLFYYSIIVLLLFLLLFYDFLMRKNRDKNFYLPMYLSRSFL